MPRRQKKKKRPSLSGIVLEPSRSEQTIESSKEEMRRNSFHHSPRLFSMRCGGNRPTTKLKQITLSSGGLLKNASKWNLV